MSIDVAVRIVHNSLRQRGFNENSALGPGRVCLAAGLALTLPGVVTAFRPSRLAAAPAAPTQGGARGAGQGGARGGAARRPAHRLAERSPRPSRTTRAGAGRSRRRSIPPRRGRSTTRRRSCCSRTSRSRATRFPPTTRSCTASCASTSTTSGSRCSTARCRTTRCGACCSTCPGVRRGADDPHARCAGIEHPESDGSWRDRHHRADR